jgi:hypothetical protein
MLAHTAVFPPTWFHYNGQSLLFSAVLYVEWNVSYEINVEKFKTVVFLSSGLKIELFGENRVIFASKCFNINTGFENDSNTGKLFFE